MRILIAIPIIINPVVAKEAIEQVINKVDVTVLLCNNGGGHVIDSLFADYRHKENVIIWKKDHNVYVNPIWNEFIAYFINSNQYDRLIIMNSDLTLQNDWDEILRNRWKTNPSEIIVPDVTDDKRKVYLPIYTYFDGYTQVYSNTPGIFITLNKSQARVVYPIPEECKIWFGDTWIFTILIEGDQKIVIPYNFIAFHHHSTSVQKVPGIHAMIELDKIAWENSMQDKMINKIKKLKDGFSSFTLPSE